MDIKLLKNNKKLMRNYKIIGKSVIAGLSLTGKQAAAFHSKVFDISTSYVSISNIVCEVRNVDFNFQSSAVINLLLTKSQIKHFIKMKKKFTRSTIVVNEALAIGGLIKLSVVTCENLKKHDKIKTRHSCTNFILEE